MLYKSVNTSAAGRDSLPSSLLVNCATELALFLLKIFPLVLYPLVLNELQLLLSLNQVTGQFRVNTDLFHKFLLSVRYLREYLENRHPHVLTRKVS